MTRQCHITHGLARLIVSSVFWYLLHNMSSYRHRVIPVQCRQLRVKHKPHDIMANQLKRRVRWLLSAVQAERSTECECDFTQCGGIHYHQHTGGWWGRMGRCGVGWGGTVVVSAVAFDTNLVGHSGWATCLLPVTSFSVREPSCSGWTAGCHGIIESFGNGYRYGDSPAPSSRL